MNLSTPVSQARPWVRELKSHLEKDFPIQPEDMYDPALLHPYKMDPQPAWPARADCDRVLRILAKSEGKTLENIWQARGHRASQLEPASLAAGFCTAVALPTAAIGALAALAGGSGHLLVIASSLFVTSAALGIVLSATAQELRKDEQLLKGWDSSIQDGNPPRRPIRAYAGPMNMPYFNYCERTALNPPHPAPVTP